MDADRLRERLSGFTPHYIAMLVLILLVVAIVRAVVGDVSIWIEVAIVIISALAYCQIVRVLGIAPSGWE